MVIPNVEETDILETSRADDDFTNLDRQDIDDSMTRSVVEHDDNTVDNGKLMSNVINHGFSSFTPDMVFDKLVKDYAMARNMFGESLIRHVTGYNANYVQKNIKIPEFQRELKSNIASKTEELKKEGYIEKDGSVTKKGVQLASLILYTEELDHLIPKGFFGEKTQKKQNQYGMKNDIRGYLKGDSYKNIAVHKTVRTAIRRGRGKVRPDDLAVFTRKNKGSVYVMYAMDASGSMKGIKIEAAKKAGIALSYKAISNKDKAGFLAFNTEVIEEVAPTNDFSEFLFKIAGIRAALETDITKAVHRAAILFPKERVTKHLILLTDALPTVGKDPEREAIEAVSMARNMGITVSLIGISLDKQGAELAQKICDVGEGRLYKLSGTEQLDKIILEEYSHLA